MTEDVAPGYFTVIKQPMDLSTIYSRMVEPPGTTARRLRMEAAEFRELFEQICANGMTFNPPQDRVWKEAFRFLQRGTAAFDELLPFTKRGATINEVLKVHADRGRLDAEALVLVAPKPRPIPKEYTLQRRAKEDGSVCVLANCDVLPPVSGDPTNTSVRSSSATLGSSAQGRCLCAAGGCFLGLAGPVLELLHHRHSKGHAYLRGLRRGLPHLLHWC